MNILALLLTAVVSLQSNKLRAGLTLLGIVIGVTAVIALMSIGRGTQASVTERLESLGTNLLYVLPASLGSGGSTLTLADAHAIRESVPTSSIKNLAPQLSLNARIVAGRENIMSQVIGTTEQYESVRQSPVESGQFLSELHVKNRSTVAVLGSETKEELFGLRSPIGQSIRINGKQFTVIGVLASKGGTFLGSLDDVILVPITTAYYRLASQRTAQGEVVVQVINVELADETQADIASQTIATVLRLRHRLAGDDDFMISSQQETIDALEDTTQSFVLFLGAIAGISLLVGGIGIMNIMLVSVTERTREIGIRKAMGAKRRDVLLQFITEATLLSIGGGCLGVLLGLSVSQIIDGRSIIGFVFQTALSLDIAALSLLVSGGIGLFFGIYPAVRASRLHPIEALRHE